MTVTNCIQEGNRRGEEKWEEEGSFQKFHNLLVTFTLPRRLSRCRFPSWFSDLIQSAAAAQESGLAPSDHFNNLASEEDGAATNVSGDQPQLAHDDSSYQHHQPQQSTDDAYAQNTDGASYDPEQQQEDPHAKVERGDVGLIHARARKA
jgi:hypothetical protein